MLYVTNVLAAIDFSDAAGPVLDHALHLARQFRATLHVLNVSAPGETYRDRRMQQEAGADAVFQAWIRQAVRERMNLVVRAHAPGTLEVRPAHVAGASASKAILTYA